MCRAAAGVLGRYVRFDPRIEQLTEELFMEVSLVSAHARWLVPEPPLQMLQDRQAPLFLRRAAAEDLLSDPQQDPVPVLHHRVDRVARIRSRSRRTLRH